MFTTPQCNIATVDTALLNKRRVD